ncbi:hypothetical protein [Kitasatospora sp. NPDC047058]|uniref:hypothetical protein n=1 Tax=Kitasatospora sp. NPDC047058 TaxID=3155620 RepID=UPI0033DDD8D7
MASTRLWAGLDPVEPGPQPSRPSPAFGAPHIGQRTITPSKEETPMPGHANSNYERTPSLALRPWCDQPPEQPAPQVPEQKPESK